ncbi:hypothetical protein CWE12_10590 [Aliidiomarina sedimenti]|uniref:Membrane protein FxsA n=2 Tax=Aliidiomarina TaxID=1249554 RepID=A0A432WFT7_9GAMM|nr:MULTISPECIES: FxsA family protein [Aliidiomarina]RUO29415.1 hypothetical protein CWE12_10590 [Aliidiomarina sedimenti]RUO32623.1 hypothetical protein CWE14_10830 [Aliidiomarina soli]
MLQILLLLFIAVPIVEIAVLLQVGDLIGGLNTLVVIILTAVIGALLVKQQGIQNWMRMQSKMARGQMPGEEMAGGLLIFLAGVLLITPGFVTDVIGLLFLLPPTRSVIAKAMLKRMVIRGAGAQFSHFQRKGPAGRDSQQEKGTTIDGEYQHKAGSESQLAEPSDDNDQKKN